MNEKLILREIENKNFQPVYFLHGEEPYFIDLISNALIKNALEEHEKEFNQSVLYGKGTDHLVLINELKSFPMGSEKRLVVLKEAQDFKKIEDLCSYFENPNPSTIFVICHKYKKYDSRKKSLKLIAKQGQIFLSEKIKEYQLNEWIQRYVTSQGFTLNSKATMLLGEFLGNDLGRIVNEVEKLGVIYPKGAQIDEKHIEENIGISKDYNLFELTNAVAAQDIHKAYKIIHYFELNPKAVHLPQIVSSLFTFFSNVLKIHFLKFSAREAIAKELRVHPFVAGELSKAKSKFSPKKLAFNMEVLQDYDLKSKGYGNTTSSQADLMKELIFKLLNP
ncbi:MAG: DNA polymerase III subunit delta [Crocinitomicaceae bacterium]|nr:DNA polymerase III subunit delta [Crocinitomicaceae bacterium]MDG1735103.1 DNA polymerase III subunit delta [Crocinitomicaceae bacterium]MDG2506435.1 DNA polymerase III subunit delta [Crocinitomicaceae bacterium]